ncbi:MAG TPA: TIGR04222 domain-containing membrane protein [Micromonosporaceae bacterium]
MRATLAVAGTETWGFSGPDFLKVYIGLGAAVSALAVILFLWTRYRSGTPHRDSRASAGDLTPADAAYLRGGPAAAVLCALAALRTRGLVLAPSRRRLATSRTSVPGETSGLERAVHEAVRRQAPYRRIARAPQVREELDAVDTKLTDMGLLSPGPHRTVLRAVELAMFAILAVGIARIVAGIGNQKPVGYLLLSLVGFGTVVIWFHFLARRFPRTRFGDRVLGYLNSRYIHLAPAHHPSWRANGAETAAMSVALFGAAAVYASDPTFATRLGMSDSAAASGGSSYSDGSGGAGAGCGGGGCGGGGGGGCGGGGCGG